jgi:O-antigen/teichoic acid export membrane protein
MVGDDSEGAYYAGSFAAFANARCKRGTLPSARNTCCNILRAMSLRHQSIVAVGSGAALSLVGDVVRLATMMVMARLLTPEDYGTFGLAFSAMLWVGALGFENFAPNLLRHRGEGQIGTYMLFGLILQSCLLVVGMVVAAFLYFQLEHQLVAALLAVGLLSLPMKVPQQIEQQLLQREFNWRRFRLVELSILLSASGLSVLLAYIGAGPFALIAAIVLEPLPFAVLLFASRQFEPPHFNRELLKNIQTFGWPMVGSSIAWRTRELTSSWAVGTVLGAAELGILGRATGLAGLVLGRFSGQVAMTLLPILVAAHGEPTRRLRVGNLLLSLIVWSQVPLAVCLTLLAAPAVLLLYGQRWAQVIDLLPLVSILTLMRSGLTLFQPLLIAVGATRDRLVVDMVYLASAIAALGGLAFGLSAYILACTVAVVVPTLYASYAVHREGWIDGRGARDALVPALTAVVMAMSTAWPIWQHTHGTIGAIFAAIVFVSVYFLALRVLFSTQLDELVSMLPKSELVRRVLLLGPNANVVAQAQAHDG